jgi:transposase
MLEVKVENCAGIDVGKKFLAVCVLTGPADRKPVGEVRRFGTSVKRLRAGLVETKCTEAVMESTVRCATRRPSGDKGRVQLR